MEKYKDKELVIKLSGDTLEKYMDYASNRLKAEIDADCEPSGVTLMVNVDPIYSTVDIKINNQLIELGEIDVDLVNKKGR